MIRDAFNNVRESFSVVRQPRKILMLAGYDPVQRAYEAAGIDCVTVDGSELVKAAGAIGCLTGVVGRDPV